MKTRNLVLTALLAIPGWGCTVYTQPYPASAPPPPGAYDNQPPGDPGYDQGYDNQGYDQGYDSQAPYYDPRPDGNYDDQGSYDQGYSDPGAYDNSYDNQGPVDQSVFYGELSPYGRWIQRGSYGWVWEPTRVAVGWRPYTQGHWVNTDYGWTWISEEPWGWATYHYGRWLADQEYGWLWVPGNEWGPAWVSFQEGGGYLGWAPLPPSVGFRAGIGIQIGGLSLSAGIDPYAYSFVPEREFLNERVATVILPPARNVTFIRSTTNITRITVENDRIVNRSLPEERVAQVTGQPVRRYQLNETRNPAQGRIARVQGDQVSIFRPATTLAQARPNRTPPMVIQQRQQRMRQVQPGQSGQPGRMGQPDQPGQSGRQVQPGQPQPGQEPQPGQPRVQGRPSNFRPAPSPEDLQRKHQAEQQRLQAQQEAERGRLQQMHEREVNDQQNQGRAAQVTAEHQAEQRAMQEQHQREQQQLQARHQREQQAAQARPQPRNRQNDRQQQRERKPAPPPPPPV